MGGDVDVLAATLRSQRVLLAAHGPYTAAGVAETLGVPVGCVSKDFTSFDGGGACGAFPMSYPALAAPGMVQRRVGTGSLSVQVVGT